LGASLVLFRYMRHVTGNETTIVPLGWGISVDVRPAFD
jgi:hypothetical protein